MGWVAAPVVRHLPLSRRCGRRGCRIPAEFCALQVCADSRRKWPDWRRSLACPGRYTHLFFLDEATALAAGHRPCAECRRADYVRFKDAWVTVQVLNGGTLKAGDMDKILHPERVGGRGANRYKPTFTTGFESIPNGVMFHVGEGDPVAFLKWKDRAWAWSPEGYREGPRMGQGRAIEVLTPQDGRGRDRGRVRAGSVWEGTGLRFDRHTHQIAPFAP